MKQTYTTVSGPRLICTAIVTYNYWVKGPPKPSERNTYNSTYNSQLMCYRAAMKNRCSTQTEEAF